MAIKNEKTLYVINNKGEKEPFSLLKLQRSIQRIGAPKRLAQEIAKTIQKEAFPGIKTAEIAQKLKKLLSQENEKFFLKFNLKEGMRKLGPTGFPFEKYIGAILATIGFKVLLNQIIPGRCCPSYEIDFLAQKDNLLYIGECKYHQAAGEKVDSNVALESYARFLDIKNGPFLKQKKFKKIKVKPIIVTNTKFTTRAINYCECVGIELLGWRYPRHKGLEQIIDEYKLYPITILPSLKSFNFFVSQKMMLAKDVLQINPANFTKKTNLSLKYLTPLIEEARILLE
jgi:hypothetical protein